MRKRAEVEKKKDKARAKSLEKAANAFGDFSHASEVLTRVRTVPTRFVQFDHATRVGGYPIERFSLVHGRSSEGKTLYTLGLIDSFLMRDHYALLVDAERTTAFDWPEKLMGARAKHPNFYAIRPDSYEDTMLQVRKFLNVLAEQRVKKKIPDDTSAIVVVDSLRKLIPKDLMKEILKEVKELAEEDEAPKRGGKPKASPGRNRQGQIQAKMNAAWMDELTPLLEHAQAGLCAIAREMVDPDADMWAKKRGEDYKVGGGGSIFYDASLVPRIERAGWVTEGEGADRKTYGERHRILIRKSKIAGKDDKFTECYFHSSNGTFTPFGFDRARDVLELATKFSVVTKSGSTYSYEGKRLAAGLHNSVKMLSDNPDLLDNLEIDVRSQFPSVDPTEFDPETGELS